MKKILFSAAMALMLVSCAHDEVIEINRDGDEIQFNVVSDAATRAADVYCNNNMPEQFRVWASVFNDLSKGAPYIEGDVIAREGTGPYTWKNTSGTRYWPEEGKLQFYAVVNEGNYFDDRGPAPYYIKNYRVPGNVTDQKDILYAVTKQIAKNTGPVTLNFRHALSQIVFRAQNMNPNIYVKIKGVTICNLYGTGTLPIPAANSNTDGNTDGNIVNHDGNGDTGADRNNWEVGILNQANELELLNGGDSDYSVTFTAVDVPGDEKIKPLTSTNDTGKEFSSNAMLLLPQTTTAWAPANGNGKPENQDGTYFLVDCQIFNVSNLDKGYREDYEGDQCLWGGPVAIPAAFDWKEGKKYVYTFVFDKEGNGGYNPDPSDPDVPEPVLTPITYNVTVDDFVPVANKDYKMETK